MFGNKLIYNQSPGGKRRGLIYQSSDAIQIGLQSKFQYGPISAFSYFNFLEFTKSGKINFCIDFGSFGTWYAYLDKINFLTSDMWYPIYIIPDTIININGVTIDTTDFETVINLPSQMKIERKTCEIVNESDGSILIKSFTIIYYNVSNVPIATFDGINEYYDIKSAELNSGTYNLYKSELPQRVIINPYSANYISLESDIYYYTEMSGHIQGYHFYDINELNKGRCYVEGTVSFEKEYVGQPLERWRISNGTYNKLVIRGTNEMSITDLSDQNFFIGLPISSDYYNWFNPSPNYPTLQDRIELDNSLTTYEGGFSSPSNLQYAGGLGGYWEYLGNKLITEDFEYDLENNFVGSCDEFSRWYVEKDGGISLSNFTETWQV